MVSYYIYLDSSCKFDFHLSACSNVCPVRYCFSLFTFTVFNSCFKFYMNMNTVQDSIENVKLDVNRQKTKLDD